MITTASADGLPARPVRYPWDQWLSRRVFVLRRGTDYRCRTYAMSIQVRSAAARRGLKVSLVLADDDTIVVRVSRENGASDRERGR